MRKARMFKDWICLAVMAAAAAAAPAAYGNSCTTQAQMTAAQRSYLMNAAERLVGEVQTGDIQALRDNTLTSVAANFGGIANSATALQPKIQRAGITVDGLYAFDTGTAQQTGGAEFFCTPTGSPMTVVLNFSDLPPGNYALAILHATGVQDPQQISLILAKTQADQQWKLAGFFNKPLLLNGRDGVWYWSQARYYAQQKMNLAAWLYYQIAEYLVEPANFLSSPNMGRLTHEADQARPVDLPGAQPEMVAGKSGETFEVTKVNTSDQLGGLDVVVHYTPSTTQAAELVYPTEARKQVLDLMTAMLGLHPGLRSAFHGMWVFAGSGNVAKFSLELPMDQIVVGPMGAGPYARPAGQ